MSSYGVLTPKAKLLIVTGLKEGPVGNRDCVVGVATRYSLGRLLFEPPWRREFFPTRPDTLLGPSSPPA